MLFTLLLLQIAAGAKAPSAPDSVAVVNRLKQEAGDFLWAWRFSWQASEASRHMIDGGIFNSSAIFGRARRYSRSGYSYMSTDRLNQLHCHPDGREGFPLMTTAIAERRRTLRAVCPQWAATTLNIGDERLGIDNSLIESLRSGIRFGRAELLSKLERAAGDMPGDTWIAGQRVRFAVDQQDWDEAARAVAACRVSQWWCSALRGYVLYSRAEVIAADSAFMVAERALPADKRCAWIDLSWLIDEESQNAYRKIPCEKRDSENARIWWLADPLYTEPGNERRAEHFARVMMASLRSAVEPTERWNWREGGGGAALSEMVVRYGWPTYAWWAGPAIDESHYGYLGIRDRSIQRLGVFSTMEYSQDRYHTVPEWSAIEHPFRAVPSDWNLAGKPDDRGRPSLGWWPQEHFARESGQIISIDEAQAALLRRHDHVELAVAADLAPYNLATATVRSSEGTLIVSPSPDSLVFTKAQVALTGTGVWRANIDPRPAVVGVEVRANDSFNTVGRVRFGIEPPAPLSVMSRGDIGISMPVLMQPPTGTRLPDSDPSTALASMLGTTVLRDMSRVGIYWETYGIPRGDSVDIAIAIERKSNPGALRRLGTALGLVSKPSNTVTIRWHEPAPGYVSTTIDGPEPIQARNVSIDLSRLVPDKYTVTVSVTRNGQTASASRDFTLLK